MDGLGFWFGLAIIAALLTWAYFLYRNAQRDARPERELTPIETEFQDFVAERREADRRARKRAREMARRKAA